MKDGRLFHISNFQWNFLEKVTVSLRGITSYCTKCTEASRKEIFVISVKKFVKNLWKYFEWSKKICVHLIVSYPFSLCSLIYFMIFFSNKKSPWIWKRLITFSPHGSLLLWMTVFSVCIFFLNHAFCMFVMSVVYLLKMVLVLKPSFLVHQHTTSPTPVVTPRISLSWETLPRLVAEEYRSEDSCIFLAGVIWRSNRLVKDSFQQL